MSMVMTIASFLAIIAALLVRIAFYSELFGGGRSQQRPGRPAHHVHPHDRQRGSSTRSASC